MKIILKWNSFCRKTHALRTTDSTFVNSRTSLCNCNVRLMNEIISYKCSRRSFSLKCAHFSTIGNTVWTSAVISSCHYERRLITFASSLYFGSSEEALSGNDNIYTNHVNQQDACWHLLIRLKLNVNLHEYSWKGKYYAYTFGYTCVFL